MVRTTARRLRSRTLEFQKPDGTWYITGWINSAELVDDSTIEFCIDSKLTPQLLQLKSAYLSTPAAPLMEFRCDYTARFYFLLKKMLKIGEFEYTLDFFRERFNLSKAYRVFFNLKNKNRAGKEYFSPCPQFFFYCIALMDSVINFAGAASITT